MVHRRVPLPAPRSRFREEIMKSHTHYLWFNTKSRQEIIDITDEVADQVGRSGVAEGLALVSAMHISASVCVKDHSAGPWAELLRGRSTTTAAREPQDTQLTETLS